MASRLLITTAAIAMAALPLFSATPRAEHPAIHEDPDSAAACGKCHTEFHTEWQGRAHANAWTDEVYQESLKDKTRPQACHACHIPEDVHARLGRKPQPRQHLIEEGVTCVSCHKSAATGANIMGPFGAKTDAHGTVASQVFQVPNSTELCASCHSTKIGPVLPLGRDHQDEYQKALGAEAKGCVECHMPEVERHLAVDPESGEPVGEKRMTRRHEVLGPRDPEFLASAFELGASKVGDEVVISVKNVAGHRVPGLQLRKFVVAVVQLGENDEDLASSEISIDDENDLKTQQTGEFRFAHAAGATRVTLTIHHAFQGEVVTTTASQQFDL